jgi:hypothetical protein
MQDSLAQRSAARPDTSEEEADMAMAPDDPSWLRRFTGTVDKATAPFGGAGNLGLALLANSGYSTTPRSFGQVLGASALQGQQLATQRQQAEEEKALSEVRKRYMEAQIGALNAKPVTGQPSSVQEYEYAKKNGFKGSFEEWQTKSRAQSDPAEVAAYKYWSSLTPQQQQDFLKLKRNVGSDYAIETVNGVPTVVYKPAAGGPGVAGGTPLVTPLTTLPNQAAGASAMKQAEASGGALGKAEGEISGGIQTKGSNAKSTLSTLDIAEPLIDAATGSATGSARDAVAAFFGKSTSGAEAIAQLRVLQANLMTSMPRMEGPQSDRDVELYRQAAGQIGDPSVPASIKKAAVKVIRELQDKYVERAGGMGPSGVNGAKRIQSDAEFDALPKGAQFIGPDGKLRRKP